MMIKAIIFDLDGTLIDSMGLWRQVDEEFLSQRGCEVPPDLFDHLPQGNSFVQTAQYFRERFGLEESVEDIMKIWTEMVHSHYCNVVELKPGVKELLKRIKDTGLKIGLATSNSYELAEKSLTFNGVWHYFEAVVTGDMHLMGKPYPDIFLRCAEVLSVRPKECIAIEDTLMGVQAAKAAGMQALAIYDEDSADHHPGIKDIADAFLMNYEELAEELHRRVNI